MKILYMHRHIRFGVIHIKNYSIFTHRNWCFVRFRATESQVPPSWAVARLHFKEKKLLLNNILAHEQVADYLQQTTIPWEDVKTAVVKIPDIGVDETTFNSSVLKSCLHLKLVDVAISFYKDILRKGEKLTGAELSIVLKIFEIYQNKIPEYEDVIRDIFDIYKSHIKEVHGLQSVSCSVFSNVKDLWKEMVKICEGSNISGKSAVIAKAFDYDEPDLGWKFLYKEPQHFKEAPLISYLNYCIRRAKANQFSVCLIDDLVNYCQKFVTAIPCTDLFGILYSLVTTLNRTPNQKYKWSVRKSTVNLDGVCSCCKMKLNEVKVSKEEFDKVKYYFDIDSIKSNLELSHFTEDLEVFKLYLSQCSPYNIVIDGLNLLYAEGKAKLRDYLKSFLSDLEAQDKKILFIGRKHLKEFHFLKNIESRCQVFLADNISNDDVFVIYGALQGGLDTYFISRDLFRPYHKVFKDDESKRCFIKWKLTHMYNYTTQRKEIKMYRAFHSFLPQTMNLAHGLCWHFPYDINPTPRIHFGNEFTWVCLKAVPLNNFTTLS